MIQYTTQDPPCCCYLPAYFRFSLFIHAFLHFNWSFFFSFRRVHKDWYAVFRASLNANHVPCLPHNHCAQSIITRLRIIVTNFRNILTHFVWLFGLFVLNSLTYIQTSSALWPRVLVFWLFGRGLVDLVCWFWVNGDASKKAHRRAHSSFSFNPASFLFKRSSVGADVNVNKSLQKEMTVRNVLHKFQHN